MKHFPVRRREPIQSTEQEIRKIVDRLRWLCARDNDAPRFILEHASVFSSKVEDLQECISNNEECLAEKDKEFSELESQLTTLQNGIKALLRDESGTPKQRMHRLTGGLCSLVGE